MGMLDVFVPVIMLFVRIYIRIYGLFIWIPYKIAFRPAKQRSRMARVKARSVDNDPSSPYRSVDTEMLTLTPFPGCSNIGDLLERCTELYGCKPALGTREVLSEEDEVTSSGRVFKKLILGQYHWMTFDEVSVFIKEFGRGLVGHLGQTPGKSHVLVFAETRCEWILAALACFQYNLSVVTLYATLGDDAIIHGVNESDCEVIITSKDQLPKLLRHEKQLPRVQHIILMDYNQRIEWGSPQTEFRIERMSEVCTAGRSLPEPDDYEPDSSDLAVIMYTSGSTGMPKGVLMSHGNVLASLSGLCQRIDDLGPDDTYVGYLPLAHVLELAAELGCLSHGCRIGYSSPLTLTDKSNKIKKGSKGDLSELQPTLMAAVPLIMDRLYKTVWETVNDGGLLKRELFKFAYDYKLSQLMRGYDTPVINRTLFKPITKVLGGRIRCMLSGGAPLSNDTQRFMNICFCCPVGQGYGLTETIGAGTIQSFDDRSVGRVGAPLGCCDIRLVNWDEGGYRTDDKPHPRGEVWIGGANVALGYFKNEKKTAEDFREIGGQRWFCTGDIGEFHEDGCLKIIDRKKDLVKLQSGEYVSLSKVETAIQMSAKVDNVCVYAEPLQFYTVALVLPNRRHLLQFAVDDKIVEASILEKSSAEQETLVDWATLCANESLNRRYLELVKASCAEKRLDKFEVPARIALIADQWLPETGLVTAAFKLKRPNIQSQYSAVLRSLYNAK